MISELILHIMCEIDRYEEHKNDGRKGCVISFIGLILLAFVVIVMMLTGCTTARYVTVPEYHTDTLIQIKLLKDSIYLKDSTHVSEKGDTMKIEHWHTKYVKKEVHDTTYISKTDTVPKPYPVEVEVEVEKPLTWWQKFRLSMANVILWFLLIWGVALGIKTYWKKFI